MKPLGDRVLIEFQDNPGKIGSIHVPASVSQSRRRGTVLAVGPGRRTENGELVPMSLKEGDVVVLATYTGGSEIDWEGKKCVIMRESDVMGVISSDE